jgi:mannose-1-phosphate guanylyltransferase/mannose-6-phosphate isomerase
VRRVLGKLRPDRLIVEPAARDTAPAVALACVRIAAADPGARVLVMPSDHAVDDPEAWARASRAALDASRSGALICLGVTPRGPESAYGYLVFAAAPSTSRAAPIERFVEKPGEPQARKLIRTGRCLWNAGTFAWRVDAFFAELERQRPDIARAARDAAAGRGAAWTRLAPRSVDYAVLEGAKHVRGLRLASGWDDLGSWEAAARRAPRGRVRDVVLVDAEGAVVFGGDRLIAVVGVPGVVVVDTPDAVLVVARSRAQDVRRVVAALARHRPDLL